MADDNKRLHYCSLQLLHVEDFQAEQDYHVRSLRRLTRSVVEPGVVKGLQVTGDMNANFVKVGEGMAIDKNGRQIVVLTTQTLPLPVEPKDGKLQVFIAYGEEESDPSHDPWITCNTRITETSILSAPPKSDPADPVSEPLEGVLLAEVTVKDGLLNEQPNNDVRSQAGTMVRKKIAVQKLVFEKDDVAEEQRPHLICSGANEITLERARLLISNDVVLNVSNKDNEMPVFKTINDLQDKIKELENRVQALEKKSKAAKTK